jgi:branched-chain amino acid transport system substrate-binding protein
MEKGKSIFVVGIIVALVVGLVGGYFVGSLLAPVPGPALLSGEIPVGVVMACTTDAGQVVPLTEIMSEEINSFLQSIGSEMRIRFLVEDAESSPVKALEKIQTLYARGVKVVLGVNWSSHAKGAKEYVDKNQILVISGSTSPLLAIPDDYIYRFAPDDTKQASALARVLIDQGISAIVVMQTGDAWGDGLFDALKARYEELGGKVHERIRYSPETTEFSAEVQRAASAISEAVRIYGEGKVALELLAMVDQAPVIQLTAATYPELLEVPWFGTDAYVGTTPIIEQAGELAARVGHISTWYSVARTSKLDELSAKFVNKTGYSLQSYWAGLYDSAWILTYSLLLVNKYDGEALKQVFPKVANSYFGASGWTLLNEAGDRAAGDYDLYKVVTENGKTDWALIGHYSAVSDSVTWFS